MVSRAFPPNGPKIPIGKRLAEIFQLIVACCGRLLLQGETGIGKSEFITAEARRLGLDVVVINLALFESPGELMGLPYRKGGVTRYAGVEQIRVISGDEPLVFDLKAYLDSGDRALLPEMGAGTEPASDRK